MRRTPQFITCAGLELARYFAPVYAVGSIAAASPSASQLLRASTAPNALFAVAFLFLGLDPDRYGAYRPLLLLGKAIALFSGAIALPRLLGLGSDAVAPTNAAYAMIGVVAWDAVSAAALAFVRVTPEAQPPVQAGAGGSEPEPVEID